jgi:hypothetical protein
MLDHSQLQGHIKDCEKVLLQGCRHRVRPKNQRDAPQLTGRLHETAVLVAPELGTLLCAQAPGLMRISQQLQHRSQYSDHNELEQPFAQFQHKSVLLGMAACEKYRREAHGGRARDDKQPPDEPAAVHNPPT